MTREQIYDYIEEHGSDVIDLFNEIDIQDILYGYTDDEILERLDSEIEKRRKYVNR